MSYIQQFSKRQPDLLLNSNIQKESSFESTNTGGLVEKKIIDGPIAAKPFIQHPLQSENSIYPTLAGVIEMRRNVGGNAQGEKFIEELSSASQFNRGPAGFSNSSRLHFDMLLGRDDKIGYGDYLNYDYEAFS